MGVLVLVLLANTIWSHQIAQGREWPRWSPHNKNLIIQEKQEKTTVPNITAVVPEGVTIYGSKDGKGYYSLPAEYQRHCTNLKLPDSLREITNYGFSDFYQLREVTIPKGVEEIGREPFVNCGNLRIVRNLSSQTVELPQGHFLDDEIEDDVPGRIWYVNGKKATKVPPGKTAKAKEQSFSLKYKLKGGKLTGKKAKKYRFGKITKLPSATKKGFAFLGWAYRAGQSLYQLNNLDGSVTGNLTLTAKWKKIRIKKKKHQLQIKVYNRKFTERWGVACLIATKKNMKDAVVFDLGKQYDTMLITGQNLYKESDDKCEITYNRETELLTCNIKNCKKRKTYYLEFRRLEHFEGDDEDMEEAGHGDLLYKQVAKKVTLKF